MQPPHPPWPRMLHVRQTFPTRAPVDPDLAIDASWCFPITPGARIAIGVGSRGITRLDDIVRKVVARVRAAGGQPFIVPAMGSHGGATAQGQTDLLSGFGITEVAVGAPVRASMDAVQVARTEDGVAVHVAAEALNSDGIILISRIKPHTDFRGPVESGILKMIAVGLGKQEGASAFHRAMARLGFPRVMSTFARCKLEHAPILGGVAIIEDQSHDLAQIRCVAAADIERIEPELLDQARALMPRIPMDEIDLLIVDFLGKNISGAGMDPNIVGRIAHHGYNPSLSERSQARPHVYRIFVRDLTPESHGNAVGIGMADFTTTRLVQGIDRESTYMNTLTSLAVLASKIPVHFSNDRESIEAAIGTLALDDPSQARVVRIRDTLHLGQFDISEACRAEIESAPGITVQGAPFDLSFDGEGNLPPLFST